MANTTGQKFGGRTAGAVNKTTAETKAILQKVVSNELDNVESLLEQLEPKERIDAIIKLLPYIVPKQSEIVAPEPEQPKTITIRYKGRED